MSTLIHDLVHDRLHLNPNIGGDFPLDEAVIESLPIGTKIVSADCYGSSAWTVTARISTILPDKSEKRYFLKCATEDAGRAMVEGEFNSMSAIYNVVPNFAPQPFAWGKFRVGNPDTYFFLCEFIDMSSDVPDPADFCSQLAELHTNSTSPTGKFGFHITTCHGKYPQCVGWEESWEVFYRNFLGAVLRLDIEMNGEWKELQAVSERLLDIVISKLLGALENEGSSVKPCLIHGDLWEGNVGTDFETGKVYIFDAAAFYAHNEMEIGMWRRKKLGLSAREYTQEYMRHFDISEPADQFDDRNRLYCIVFDMWHSAHHRGCKERLIAYNDILYLVNKFDPEPIIDAKY